MTAPLARVEVAFDSAPDDPVQQWTDISDYVRTATPITVTRGRDDAQSSVTPGRLSLELRNSDGRFTFGYAAGAYYPNVQPRKRIRVLVSPDAGTSWSQRFDGYVDGWPASWAGGMTEQPRVTVTATDRLSQFSGLRTLRDPLQEELGTAAYASSFTLDTALLDSTTVLAGGTVWLYGLQESSGSTTAGDVSGAPGRALLAATQVGSDGTAEFGAAGIMPEGTAVLFTPASAGNGVVLTSSTAPSYVGTEFSMWCQFAWTGSTGAQLMRVGSSGTGRVTIAATGSTVTATFVGTSGASAVATKTVTTNDNAPHFALVSVSGTTISLYVDELAAATATLPAGGMGTAQGITVGGTTSADPHQVAWAGYSNASTSATRAGELGLLATGGSERSDLRVARILRWLGLDSDLTAETGLSAVAYQATGGRTALDVVNEANEVEGGVFFASGAGLLVQQSRDHRYNSTPTLTLDATEVGGDLAVSVDTTRMVNDLRASRPRGATYRARNEDSIAAFGEFSSDVTLYAASDSDLVSAADWRVQRMGEIAPYVPGVSVNLLTSDESRRAQVLAAEIGDMLRVGGLPSATTPGGASVDLFIEGMEERFSATAWDVSLATSPAFMGNAWSLDDATFSALGSTTTLVH